MKAIEQYIRAGETRDHDERKRLLEACFAANGRFVTRSAVLVGPAGVETMLARFLADPDNLGFRLTSVIDLVGNTFRYSSVVDRKDGTTQEFFDAGELDADGKIVTMLVFAGPLQR
ncbi:MAG: nuclear transport factor 2 family protein [Kofleriaceae bacterium]